MTPASQASSLATGGPVRLPPSVHTAKVTWVSDLAYSCPANAFVLERPVLDHAPARIKPRGCDESMVDQFRHRASPGTPPMASTLRHVVALSAVPTPKLPIALGPSVKPAKPAIQPPGPVSTHPAQAVQYVQSIHRLVASNIVYDAAREGTPAGMTTLLVQTDPRSGSVTSTKILRSSGNSNWDMAVEQAVQRIARIPKDHGRWDTSVIVTEGFSKP